MIPLLAASSALDTISKIVGGAVSGSKHSTTTPGGNGSASPAPGSFAEILAGQMATK